ncbi:MAG: type IV-A pilus assembly ATPase PilB [marine bacterium B5-7]|nr:MAG: type IV-A pilus assembly ATPase PilB [marine bacterium B5-7]
MQQHATVSSRDESFSGLVQMLIEQKIVSRRAAKKLEVEAREKGITAFKCAALNDDIDTHKLYQAASQIYGLPFFDLSTFDKKYLPTTTIPSNVLQDHEIVPIQERGSKIFVAVADPTDHSGPEAIRFHTSMAVELVLVEQDKIGKVIADVASAADTSLLTLDDEGFDDLDIIGDDELESAVKKELEGDIDTPIVRFVNKMFLDAINQSASDIHVEPYERSLRIRYRVDGVLHEIPAPPLQMANQVISRIKILSRLDIAEKRVPQDGRMKLRLSKTSEIDFRISTMPTLFGEKIVIRILDTGGMALDLATLGFEPDQLAIYEEAIKRPYGMILVTGPTGSGKSISLYSALNVLNTIDRNISSVEDPVEVHLAGINQVNINEKANVGFARVLRGFLRQDPDIIMVGEIRDLETGDIAVKAAQTGHLVLSTLHTNDALGTISRLLNMGIEPFNVGSSVHLIMAQRLIRKLCTSCRRQIDIPETALLKAGFTAEQIQSAELYNPVGCGNCTDGFRGRTGIFQMLPVSDEMSTLIMAGAKQDELEKLASKEKVKTLRQAGIVKVLNGVTSLAEVERVTNI